MNEKHKAARYYPQMGFSVIPTKADKKPFVAWQQYQTQRAELSQIDEWWHKWPDANPAIVTGEVSGVMVVDADSQAGIDAVNGFLPEGLALPICKTSSGGQHFYFKYRPGLSNGVRVLTDTDFRTDGGYVIAPPSKNGKSEYAWLSGLRITEVPPPDMPDMLFDILQQGAPQASSNEHIKKKAFPSTQDVDVSRQQSSTKSTLALMKGSVTTPFFTLQMLL